MVRNLVLWWLLSGAVNAMISEPISDDKPPQKILILMQFVKIFISSQIRVLQSREEGKDQESIQSSTTPYPRHHMGKWQKHVHKRAKRSALSQLVITTLQGTDIYKVACHPAKCDVINDIELFLTYYHRKYCHKCLTLSNQMLHYKSKCIRIHI